MKKSSFAFMLCCSLATSMTIPLQAATSVEDIGGQLVNYSFDREADDSGTYSASLMGTAQFVTLDDGNRVLSTGNNRGYLDLGAQMAHNVLGQLKADYTISLDINVGINNSLGSYCWAWAMGNGTGQYSALVNQAGNANWYYEIKNSTAYKANSSKGLREEEWHTVTVVQQNSTCTMQYLYTSCGFCLQCHSELVGTFAIRVRCLYDEYSDGQLPYLR